MKYVVDKIENKIVVLENIDTNEIIEVNLNEFSFPVHEGSVVSVNDGIYEADVNEEVKRRQSLRERLEKLKSLKK